MRNNSVFWVVSEIQANDSYFCSTSSQTSLRMHLQHLRLLVIVKFNWAGVILIIGPDRFSSVDLNIATNFYIKWTSNLTCVTRICLIQKVQISSIHIPWVIKFAFYHSWINSWEVGSFILVTFQFFISRNLFKEFSKIPVVVLNILTRNFVSLNWTPFRTDLKLRISRSESRTNQTHVGATCQWSSHRDNPVNL
jgi:hypothetical protein